MNIILIIFELFKLKHEKFYNSDYFDQLEEYIKQSEPCTTYRMFKCLLMEKYLPLSQKRYNFAKLFLTYLNNFDVKV